MKYLFKNMKIISLEMNDKHKFDFEKWIFELVRFTLVQKGSICKLYSISQ